MYEIGDIIKNNTNLYFKNKFFLIVDIEKKQRKDKSYYIKYVLFNFDDGEYIRTEIISDSWKKIS